MRRFASLSFLPLAALLASSCTDATVAPTSRLRPGGARASVTSARPQSYPNSVKYRDNGFKPATGRSESATIAARALLGRSGTTDVEVTTGAFEVDAATSGQLAHVQVKGYAPSGKLFLTQSHNGLTGSTESFPYTGLARGTPLEVKAVVRAIDADRSHAVTVATAVRMRPDLVALRLEGPAQAPPGPVNFHAFIKEANGEVGARASCVLYVNGSAADRADGIWVDANGVVACAMTYHFTTVGTHALEVRVETVRPGDYDDRNNRASASISVVTPNFSAYSVQASDAVYNSWWRGIGTLTRLDGVVETWDQTVSQQGPFQFASVNGVIPRLLAFPIRLQGEMATNGTTFNSLDLTHQTGEWTDLQVLQGYCASSFSFDGGASTYVCAYTGGYLAGYTYVQYDWWGADVRYHSDSYVTWWDASGQLQEQWIASDWTQIGPMITFGSDFHAWLTVQGAGDTWATRAEATVTLSPFADHFDYTDSSCSTTPAPLSCRESHHHSTGARGFVNYGAWP